MKVSLVAPPTSVSDRYPKDHPLRHAKQITEPLGLGYLAAMLEDLAKVEIVDSIVENLSTNECVKRIADSDVVGISAVTSNIHTALNLAEQVKKLDPDKKVILGGIHPSLLSHEMLQNESVDLVVIGEGEWTIRNVFTNQPLKKIAGIAYRQNGKIRMNQPDPLESDLDVFPFPARHLLKMKKYKPFLYLKKPVHSLISSRGCPFTCTYCCRDISGKKYRVRSPENVVKEIRVLVEDYGAREVAFQDPVFGLSKKWTRKFSKLLVAEKIDVIWSALTRVDLIDQERAELMKKSGCWMLYFGIEAGNQQLLDIMKKRTSLNMIRKAVKTVSRANIKTWGSFMFALPGENPVLAQETLDFAKSLPLDFASFHLTTPFLGTELRKNVDKWGQLKTDDVEYTQLNPVFVPHGWKGKEEELKQFYADAFNKFYVRARYIFNQLFKLRSIDEAKMYFRGLKVVK